jgi:hypothetical protein
MAKTNVYLGTVAVVPRADLKRHFERPMEPPQTDNSLQLHLESVLSLPKAPADPASGDRAIDVLVAKHQGGEAWEGSVGDWWLPILWRPSVEVSTRLYALKDKKHIATFHVKKCLAWREYFSRIFTLSRYFSFRSPFTNEDMATLLDEALVESLARVNSSL